MVYRFTAGNLNSPKARSEAPRVFLFFHLMTKALDYILCNSHWFHVSCYMSLFLAVFLIFHLMRNNFFHEFVFIWILIRYLMKNALDNGYKNIVLIFRIDMEWWEREGHSLFQTESSEEIAHDLLNEKHVACIMRY